MQGAFFITANERRDTMKVKTVKNFYDRKEGVDRKAEDKEPFEVTPERYKQIQQYVEIVEEKKESKKESKEE